MGLLDVMFSAIGGANQVGPLIVPLTDYTRISSPFGTRDAPRAGASTNHMGIDYAAPMGTPVYASHSGTVLSAGLAGGYGNLIKLTGNNGLETSYGHLSGFATGIAPGQSISQGDIIGYVGSTGNSTGPHLHYETRVDGIAIDPNKLTVANVLSSVQGWFEKKGTGTGTFSFWTGEELTQDQLDYSILGKHGLFGENSPGGWISGVGDWFGEWLQRGVTLVIGIIIFIAAMWMLTASGTKVVVQQAKTASKRFAFK